MRFLLLAALAPTALALAIPAIPTTTPFAAILSAHNSHHTTIPLAILASVRATAIPATPTTTPFAAILSAHNSHHTTIPLAVLASVRASYRTHTHTKTPAAHPTHTHTPTHTKSAAAHPTHTQSIQEQLDEDAAHLQAAINAAGPDPHCPAGYYVSRENGPVPMQRCKGPLVTDAVLHPQGPNGPIHPRAEIPSDFSGIGSEQEDEELSGAVSKRTAKKQKDHGPSRPKPTGLTVKEQEERLAEANARLPWHVPGKSGPQNGRGA